MGRPIGLKPRGDKNLKLKSAAQVRIVRERTTDKIMAMKKLKKSEMLRRGQV